MEQAAVFLAASILLSLAATVVIIAVVVVNNLLYTYWKPVELFTNKSFDLPRYEQK